MKFNKKNEVYIVLIAILIVLILGLLIWAIQAGKLSPRGAIIQAATATLAVSPASGNIVINSTLDVNIILNTGGQNSAATDVKINFNPQYLQVVDQDAATTGVQITQGTIYAQYPVNSTDNVTGLIRLSGAIAGSGTPTYYNGTGTFGTIRFRAIAQTTITPVTFQFTAGGTTDCNVGSSTGEDILLSVTNGSYAVTIASPSNPSSLTATAVYDRITLNWTASTAGTYPIAGYSVYRGTASGGQSPTPIANVTSGTSYADTTPIHGTTYYYIVKAYDNQTPANYSNASNEVSSILLDPTLTINITLERKTNHTASNNTLKIYPQGNTTTLLQQKTFNTSSAGQGQVVVSLSAGTYDFYVKPTYYVSNKLTATIVASGGTLNFGTFSAGDFDNNDQVNSLDWNIMIPTWGTANAICDINGDGEVNALDYPILLLNWGKTGPMPK